jgi:PAB1-binding protein PBP1
VIRVSAAAVGGSGSSSASPAGFATDTQISTGVDGGVAPQERVLQKWTPGAGAAAVNMSLDEEVLGWWWWW